ncbi:MAG: hypothetical protein WD226_00200, partial [Planctomycetota bacterium]
KASMVKADGCGAASSKAALVASTSAYGKPCGDSALVSDIQSVLGSKELAKEVVAVLNRHGYVKPIAVVKSTPAPEKVSLR